MAINVQAANQYDAQASRGTRSARENEFVPKEGQSYVVALLPRDLDEYYSENGAPTWGYEFSEHYSYKKPNGEDIYSIKCPKSDNPLAQCPICKEGWDLYNAGDEESKKLAKRRLLPQKRVYVNILDLSSQEAILKGVQFWSAPHSKVFREVHEKYLTQIAQWVDNKDVLDINGGRNFQLTIIPEKTSGTGFTNYTIAPLPAVRDLTPYLNVVPGWQARIQGLKNLIPESNTYDSVLALIGKTTTAVAPAPIPTAVAPAPIPTAVAPAPIPTAVAPAPIPTAVAPAPIPTAVAPAPIPTAVAPAPIPTAVAPAPIPTAVAPAPSDIPVPAANGARPECFGTGFQSRNATCVACTSYADCKVAFMNN